MPLDFSKLTEYSTELGAAFGFMTPKEIWTMRVCTWSLPPHPLIVNVGAGAGTSGLAFRESRPDATIFTVDISAGGPLGGLENERNAFAGKPLEIPHQILGDSKATGQVWNRGPADLVFIDGDHSYEGCLGDLLAWRDHVKSGGLLLIHDFGRDAWPDVVRATESGVLAEFECLFCIDTLWVGRKA